MGKRATVRLTSTGNAIFSGCDHPELHAAWTTSIPESARSCDPQRRRWWFAAEYVDQALAIAERYDDVALIDGPRWRATACPCQGLVHRLRRLAGGAA